MTRHTLDTLFPARARVVFQNNPLVEVTCHVEFLPELSIAAKPPSSFQKHIKHLFPLYDIVQSEEDGPQHAFLSEDSTWRVLLTRSWMSLSTTVYTRWEEFEEKWRCLVSALQDVYSDIHEFRGLSLRYIDALDRQELDLADTPWSELIREPMGGLLHHLESSPEYMFQEYVLALDEHQELLMRFGFSDHERDDPRFMLDMTFFHTHAFEVSQDGRIQQELRRFTSRIFSGFLTDKARAALAPSPIEP